MILFMPNMAWARMAATALPLIRYSTQGRGEDSRSNTNVALRLPILSTIGEATKEKTRAEAFATVMSVAIRAEDRPCSMRKRLR